MNIEDEVEQLRKEGYVEGELSIDPLWYILWDPKDIIEFNTEYEISEYAPGFMAFGDNGSNELLAIDPTGVIVVIPAIGMDPKYAITIAKDFNELRSLMQKNI